MTNKFLIALCITALFVPAFSVDKCYVCEYFDNSDLASNVSDENCLEDPTKVKLVECDLEFPGENKPIDWQCSKVSGRIEIEEENYNVVIRSCSPGRISDATCKDTQSFDTKYGKIKRGKSCVCEEDECNSGTSIAVGVVLLTFGAIASLFPRI